MVHGPLYKVTYIVSVVYLSTSEMWAHASLMNYRHLLIPPMKVSCLLLFYIVQPANMQ